MRVAIATDHAGFALKQELKAWLNEQGHAVTDLGTDGTASVDYPDYGRVLAERARRATDRPRHGQAVRRHLPGD